MSGDLAIHRVRFARVDSNAIHRLAFSGRTSRPSLAVARSDASIEIWSTGNGEDYYKDFRIPGRADLSVESLAWSGKRLFSAGLTGQIVEWDLLRLRPRSSMSSIGGAVWCVGVDKEGATLAAGCEDGQLCLFSIEEDGLAFSRCLSRQEGRVLSLAWHPGGKSIVVGGADSTVRKIDVTTGHCVLRITLDDFKKRSTLAWDVKMMSDDTIISADSTGKIQFWNGKFGTLRQCFRLHKADVLTLAMDDEEETLFAAGVDPKIVKFQRMGADSPKWVSVGEVRRHLHDIHSLALSKNGILASGSSDSHFALYGRDNFSKDDFVWHKSNNARARDFSVAEGGRVLMQQTGTALQFWQLKPLSQKSQLDSATEPSSKLSATEPSSKLPASDLPVHFLEIKAKGSLHILSSVISHDGQFVAFSNIERLWLYRILEEGSKVKCLACKELPSYCMQFTRDGARLVMATIKDGVVMATSQPGKDMETKPLLPQKESSHPVTSLEISPDGDYLAVCNCRSRITVYHLEGDEASLVAKLPRFEEQPVLFTFSPSSQSLVLFSGLERTFFLYDIEEESLSCVGELDISWRVRGCWTLANPSGIVPVRGRGNTFAVYDSNCVVYVKCGVAERARSGGKRGREEVECGLENQLVRCERVQFVHPLGEEGEMVVVEQTRVDYATKLPPALKRKRYGG